MRRPAATLPLCLLLASGCAVSCAPSSSTAPGALPASERISLLAQSESSRNGRINAESPLPPGVPADLFDTDADHPPRATLTLDEAVAAITRAQTIAEPDERAGVLSPPGAALALSAQRLYTKGRAALLAGQIAEASALFEQVVAIDPDAGSAWSSLGMIRASLGDPAGAANAWRETLRLDPGSTRALEQLGSFALQRQSTEEALNFLARAAAGDPGAVDAALPYLVDASLTEALQREGYLAAAAEAAERAASLPAPFDRPTLEQRRLLSLLRQRSLLLRQAGDLRLSLGDLAGAAAAYDRAIRLDDSPDAQTIARAIAVHQRRAADASAANTLIAALDASQGRVDSLHVRLVSHLANTIRAGSLSRSFAEAVRDSPARAGWPDTPASRSAAVRLAAAAERAPDASSRLLLDHIRDHGPDDAATEQLARSLGARPADLASALIELVGHRPLLAQQFTALFARNAADRAAFTRALAATTPPAEALTADALSPAEAAALASSWLSLRAGDPEDALRRVGPLLDSASARPYATLVGVEAHAARGDTAQAIELIDSLRSDGSAESALLAASSDAHLQRHDDALAIFAPLLSSEHNGAAWRGDAFVLAARSAAATGQIENAERWLRAATELQPLREDAYAGLIQIYLASDPQRARAQLADTVRRLRENLPSSRTLRLLQARELASQGQPDAASEILLDLLELDDKDAAAEEQLIATLVGAGRVSDAEAWLGERLRALEQGDAPDARTASLLLLARVYASSDRTELAVETLEAELERSPRSEAVLRSLEELYRGPLRDEARADEYALERLRVAPPTLDNTLELAEARARRGEWDESLAALERALSRSGVSLRRDQRDRASRTLLTYAASAESLNPSQARLAADGAGMLIEETAGAPDALHRARVVLLIRAEAPTGELLDATGAPARDNAALALQLRSAVSNLLVTSERPDDALRFAREGYRLGGRAVPELLAEWLRLAIGLRNSGDAIQAVRAAREADADRQTYDALASLFGGGENEEGGADDLAYFVGQIFDSDGSEADADAMYHLALEFNPNHPWSANNVGYRLAERGEDLVRAHDLLVRAYAGMPNEIAIIDSLGWARYRLGILEDTQNAQGQRIEGAVTLLRRAATTATAPEDGVIHDHLGDAYWRAGEAQRAMDSWRLALRLSEQLIAERTPDAERNPFAARMVRDARAVVLSVRDKLVAAQRFADTGAAPQTPETFPELREEALRAPIPVNRPPEPATAPAGF